MLLNAGEAALRPGSLYLLQKMRDINYISKKKKNQHNMYV